MITKNISSILHPWLKSAVNTKLQTDHIKISGLQNTFHYRTTNFFDGGTRASGSGWDL